MSEDNFNLRPAECEVVPQQLLTTN